MKKEANCLLQLFFVFKQNAKYCVLSLRKVLIQYQFTRNPLLLEIHYLRVVYQIHSRGNPVVFFWVPGRMNIQGNDNAGRVEKEAAVTMPADATILYIKDLKRLIKLSAWKKW